MNIQNGPLGGIVTPGASPTEATAPERSNRFRTPAGPSTGHDQVELSDLTSRISQASQAASLGHAQRVARLAKVYEQGRYAPHPSQVSHAVVNAWLGGQAASRKE